MVRIFAAVIIWIVFVGTPTLYIRNRGPKEAPVAYEQQAAPGILSLVLTPAFDVQPDAFAVNSPAAALRVRLNGREIASMMDQLPAGQPLEVKNASGLVVGKNEFFVEAYPSQENSVRSQALRVQVLRDGQPVADHTLWSEPGTPVTSTFTLEVPDTHSKTEDDHGH